MHLRVASTPDRLAILSNSSWTSSVQAACRLLQACKVAANMRCQLSLMLTISVLCTIGSNSTRTQHQPCCFCCSDDESILADSLASAVSNQHQGLVHTTRKFNATCGRDSSQKTADRRARVKASLAAGDGHGQVLGAGGISGDERQVDVGLG